MIAASFPQLGVAGVSILGVLVLVSFALVSVGAAAGTWGCRGAALIEASAITVGTLLMLLFALALSATKCDESCDDGVAPIARSGHWWHMMHSWQWGAQLLLGVAGAACAVTGLALTTRGRHGRAVTAMVGVSACVAGWAAMVAPMGNAFGI